MEISDAFTLIGNGLFPIVVCYFLYKILDKTLAQNTKAIDNLSDSLTELKATMQAITTYIIERKDG